MRPLALLVVLAGLAAPVASGQVAAADSVAVLPPFRIPIKGDFAPPQTSALRAYAYSAGVAGGTVALGYLLHRAPEGGSMATSSTAQAVGAFLMVIGAGFGSSAGNVSLGAMDDVTRAAYIRMVGVFGGTVGIVGLLAGSGEVFVVGTAVMGAGLVGGVAYDLATIPGNAARARRYRQAYPRVSIAPGWRAGAPALGVRVGL